MAFVVTLKADRTVLVGEETVDASRFTSAIDLRTRCDLEQRIFLRADRSMTYEDVTRILNLLRGTGAEVVPALHPARPGPHPGARRAGGGCRLWRHRRDGGRTGLRRARRGTALGVPAARHRGGGEPAGRSFSGLGIRRRRSFPVRRPSRKGHDLGLHSRRLRHDTLAGAREGHPVDGGCRDRRHVGRGGHRGLEPRRARARHCHPHDPCRAARGGGHCRPGDGARRRRILRGTDVLKALAPGTTAVLTGRAWATAVAAAGALGAACALEVLVEEFATAMALCGCRTLADITPDLIEAPGP